MAGLVRPRRRVVAAFSPKHKNTRTKPTQLSPGVPHEHGKHKLASPDDLRCGARITEEYSAVNAMIGAK